MQEWQHIQSIHRADADLANRHADTADRRGGGMSPWAGVIAFVVLVAFWIGVYLFTASWNV